MPDTLFGALQLTLIDMTVVFAVLFGLAAVIRLTQRVVTALERPGMEVSLASSVPAMAPEAPLARISPERVEPESAEVSSPLVDSAEVDADILAVIAGAMAAYQDGQPGSYVIRSVVPVPSDAQSAWLMAGRRRLMESRGLHRQRRR